MYYSEKPQSHYKFSFLLAVAIVFVISDDFANQLIPLTKATESEKKKYSGMVQGPFFSDPALMVELDCPDDNCQGPLNFSKLIKNQYAQSRLRSILRTEIKSNDFSIYSDIPAAQNELDRIFPPGINPFELQEARKILETITSDLQDVSARNDAIGRRLDPDFLTNEGSRVELVGIINRMDRQFHRQQRESACGEISLIYRFSYSLREGKQESRLPVTMNIVFPASNQTTPCNEVASRWLDAIKYNSETSPLERAKALVDPTTGALAPLLTSGIVRLELNMQAYRKPAGIVEDFGTEAAYVIRVFRWDENSSGFIPSYLPNQIDRNSLICLPEEAQTICEVKARNRAQLVNYLQTPDVVKSVDDGTLDIPSGLGILARRALTISPGGLHRSRNQPYWNSELETQQIISDDEILDGLDRAVRAGVKLEFISSADDFRTRLNDSTCSGCHQSRAIAGFHFPGADREGTPIANSILIPGSPHFYGDQPRRLSVVRQISDGKSQSNEDLITNYSARPHKKYNKQLSGTSLAGGWGSSCTMPEFMAKNARKWSCKTGYECSKQFVSKNYKAIGTCVPKERMEIGDPVQQGNVVTFTFGKDKYSRISPLTGSAGDNRIPKSTLPKNPPYGNSYSAAHQEFHFGISPNSSPSCTPTITPECYDIRRDRFSGGFPSGSLGLAECLSLPSEATCGLVASSGFNACIRNIGTKKDYDVNLCFNHFTSFAALRACNVNNPCRDDYICRKPIGYTVETAIQKYNSRLAALMTEPYFKDMNGRVYDINDYGQKRPDTKWVALEDNRGICTPPYFVFQFRADGHPAPPKDIKYKANLLNVPLYD